MSMRIPTVAELTNLWDNAEKTLKILTRADDLLAELTTGTDEEDDEEDDDD